MGDYDRDGSNAGVKNSSLSWGGSSVVTALVLTEDPDSPHAQDTLSHV